MFRRVDLPSGVRGKLFLHSMPGRKEPLEQAWLEVAKEAIHTVVCLAGNRELRAKSPEYARAIEAGLVPCTFRGFEISDYGVPANREAFFDLASGLASELRAGDALLIHCGAGIGRTGMLACCVLLALGETPIAARSAISRAGSGAETDEQRELVRCYESRIRDQP